MSNLASKHRTYLEIMTLREARRDISHTPAEAKRRAREEEHSDESHIVMRSLKVQPSWPGTLVSQRLVCSILRFRELTHADP